MADCGHIIHAESLDDWLEQVRDGGAVALAECPRCKTPVRATNRYNRVINRHLQTVEAVKKKYRGEVRNKCDNSISCHFRSLSCVGNGLSSSQKVT